MIEESMARPEEMGIEGASGEPTRAELDMVRALVKEASRQIRAAGHTTGSLDLHLPVPALRGGSWSPSKVTSLLEHEASCAGWEARAEFHGADGGGDLGVRLLLSQREEP